MQRVVRQTLGSEVVNNDISKLRAFFWRAQPTASSLAAFSHGYTKPGKMTMKVLHVPVGISIKINLPHR